MEGTLDPSLVEESSSAAAPANDPDHGWQKVTYAKRQRRWQNAADSNRPRPNGLPDAGDRSQVFAFVEQKALERRRALESANATAAAAEAGAAAARSRPAAAASDDEDDDSSAEAPHGEQQNGEAAKKLKQKKPKKPKVTVQDAASKIDAADLGAFLVEVSESYESQQDIQLMRFADYFARSFAPVSGSQFPWTKMFKESPVSKIVDIPLCHISESVYKTSVDWISQKSTEALGDFVLWCLDAILADLASHQAAAKGSKKSVQQSPAKAQVNSTIVPDSASHLWNVLVSWLEEPNEVAIFVVLAMTLRRKPDTLIKLLPRVRENPKYQGQEKLPVMVWAIAQASQGDFAIGMYLWAHYLLPLICGKLNGNPQSRDLVLQLVERILSGPKARPILLNGAVKKGERLIPPAALDLLMRAACPSPNARVKATERFEVVYPALKELALAGSPGTKSTKQATQQLLPAAVKAMQENNTELTREAADIFIWCLAQNTDCYKQWEKLHLENIDASVASLRKLSSEWKDYSTKLSPVALRETLKHLRAKNEEALSGDVDSAKQTSIKDADKYCKVILGRLTYGFICLKGGVCVLLLAVAVGFVVSKHGLLGLE